MNDPKRIIVIALGFAFIGLLTFGIKGHIDSEGYNNQVNYTTALKTTKADEFNYIVDTQQGRVLASGTFTVKQGVKFDEMNQNYTFIRRVKEHYTRHTREECSTDSDGHEHCHEEVYYTWDEVGRDELEAKSITFMNREYPPSLFGYQKFLNDTNCSDFMSQGTGGGWFQTKKGCLNGDNYLNDDDRYTYETVPLNFSATFLATTYGGLKGFNEDTITLQTKSITQALHDVGQYSVISFWVVTVLLILLTIGAGIAAYGWVFADGRWSLNE